MKKISPSVLVYALLAGIVVVLSILQHALPLQLNPGQSMSWVTVEIAIVLGAAGLVLARKCGFPDMLDQEVSNVQRYWLPFGVGAGLGIVMVIFDLLAPLGTDIQTRFPDSLIVFSLAGLVEEIVVHLFLVSLFVWLFTVKLLGNRYTNVVFWIVSIGVALAYWLFQLSAVAKYFPQKLTIVFAIQTLLVIGVTITLGAYYFRKSGFLAAVSLRYGFYFVWHIVWAGGIGIVRYL